MIHKPNILDITAVMQPGVAYSTPQLAELTGFTVRTVSMLLSSGMMNKKIEKRPGASQPVIVYLYGTAPSTPTTRVASKLADLGELDYAAWGKQYAQTRALRESIKR